MKKNLFKFVLFLLIVMAVPTAWAKGKEDPQPDRDSENRVGWLKISGKISATPEAFFDDEEVGTASVLAILNHLKDIAENESYRGIVIITGESSLNLTQIYAIDQAINRIKKAGKKVIVFSETYSMNQYLLACSANKIILQSKGGVMLQGISTEEIYLARLFEKLGIKADFIQVGQYKGADEPLTRTGPSKQWSQNIDRLLDSSYSHILRYIAKRRRFSKKQVEKLLGKSWALTDVQCKKLGLVDDIKPREMKKLGEQYFGKNIYWIDLAKKNVKPMPQDIFSLIKMLMQKPRIHTQGPTIAVIHASGTITSGPSRGGSLFGDAQTIGSDTFRQTIRLVLEDKHIKGLVIHINSPGGSALASEVMWQEIKKVGKQKPVYFVVGRMAASGGYYMASAADKIYVAPTSILGSIGVVTGKITMGGLYQKLGIHIHHRTRGPGGAIHSSVNAFTPSQRKLILKSATNIYKQFTQRVKQGRKNKISHIAKVAQGRLFTGSQAVKNGLADKIGTLSDAIQAIAAKCQIQNDRYDVIHLPRPLSFAQALSQTLGLEISASRAKINTSKWHRAIALDSVRALIGEQTWRHTRPILDGYLLMQKEHTLLLLPNPIEFK